MKIPNQKIVYKINGKSVPVERVKEVTPPSYWNKSGIDTFDIKLENVKPEWRAAEGFEVRIAVTSGYAGARKLMEQIREVLLNQLNSTGSALPIKTFLFLKI